MFVFKYDAPNIQRMISEGKEGQMPFLDLRRTMFILKFASMIANFLFVQTLFGVSDRVELFMGSLSNTCSDAISSGPTAETSIVFLPC